MSKATYYVYGIHVGGVLRYIGITDAPKRRRTAHKAAMFHKRDFVMKILERHPTLEDARRRERTLVRKHKPPENVNLNPARPKVDRYVDVKTRTAIGLPITRRFRLREGAISVREARIIWRESETIGVALAKMRGWSVGIAYAAFGKRSR